jgi:hypothetical protein
MMKTESCMWLAGFRCWEAGDELVHSSCNELKERVVLPILMQPDYRRCAFGRALPMREHHRISGHYNLRSCCVVSTPCVVKKCEVGIMNYRYR